MGQGKGQRKKKCAVRVKVRPFGFGQKTGGLYSRQSPLGVPRYGEPSYKTKSV